MNQPASFGCRLVAFQLLVFRDNPLHLVGHEHAGVRRPGAELWNVARWLGWIDGNRSTEGPHGDKGGNAFLIRVKEGGAVINLHSLWDGLLGNDQKYRAAGTLGVDHLFR